MVGSFICRTPHKTKIKQTITKMGGTTSDMIHGVTRHVYNNSDEAWRIRLEAREGLIEASDFHSASQEGESIKIDAGGSISITYRLLISDESRMGANDGGRATGSGTHYLTDSKDNTVSYGWIFSGYIFGGATIVIQHRGVTAQMDLNRPANGDIKILGDYLLTHSDDEDDES
jgi:hypothetical protein